MDATSIVAFVSTTSLAFVALSPSPNAAGIVGLLTALQMYPRFFSTRSAYITPWAASTIGATMSHFKATSNALQGPSVLSMTLLMVISAVVSAISVGGVYLDARVGKKRRYNWCRLAGFAAFWATIWGTISLVTPVGRLLTWSPVTGLGPYTWVSAFLGPWGIDFIVAAWSVTLTEFVATPLSQGASLIGPTPYADNPDEPTPQDRSMWNHKTAFTLSLLALAIPGFWTPRIPNPTYTISTTPFTLGCVLPQTHLPHRTPHSPTLTDYITETKKMTNAKLLLWPEGALKFDTKADRNATLNRIFKEVLEHRKGFHIGFGFEENFQEPRNNRASKRNGFALLVDDQVVLQYYKRNLVPLVESFSILPAVEAPAIYELPLGPPSGTRKSDWAEGPDHTRPVAMTSSICLDFASQSSFLSLDSRPALILAPARTWHPSVGLAMWHQARQRAHETGSTVLWCDGGEGGLSGVIGDGFDEPFQFGEGPWTRTIGLAYPFSERKTVFTAVWVGNLGGFIVVWMLTGVGFVTQVTQMAFPVHTRLSAWIMAKVNQGFARILHRAQPEDAEQGRLIEDGGRNPLLLDLDDDEQEQHRRQQMTTYGAVQHA